PPGAGRRPGPAARPGRHRGRGGHHPGAGRVRSMGRRRPLVLAFHTCAMSAERRQNEPGTVCGPAAVDSGVTGPSFPGGRLPTVCGSLQHRSATGSVLDAAAAGAEAAGATVETFAGLADLPAFDPERADEPIPAVAAWRAQVSAADAVLIACP